VIDTIAQLEDKLSAPLPAVVETLRRLQGDILVLGIAGKLGPTLARMAKRASELAGVKRRIIGVARFSSEDSQSALEKHGIETIRCDLLNESTIQDLPDAPNILYLAGMKFGATGQESLTWAMNALVPALVCKRYSGSRIVAFSTGNVYGLVPVAGGGSRETDAPSPVGEYAMSCLGRERVFEHFSRVNKTPVALIRLNYACDLRYGVLVDLAQKIVNETSIDLGMSWFNTIWQGDANAITMQCLEHASSPPLLLNMTGAEILNVRKTGETLGRLLGKTPRFIGTELDTALLSNTDRATKLFGPPTISADELIQWVADWIRGGGPTLNKPTHFENRAGRF
jgi:nucleoside-diphosphate-sugar epimerase